MSLVQPTGDVETNKKVRPPPFYVSLIIGGKLVHNCMIDSGASSSVMPRCVSDALGMKYEPIVRDVLQLDGSTVKTLGVLKCGNGPACMPWLHCYSRHFSC